MGVHGECVKEQARARKLAYELSFAVKCITCPAYSYCLTRREEFPDEPCDVVLYEWAGEEE